MGVHKIVAAPLTFAHIRVGIFVEGRTIEFLQAVGIHSEVDGYEIHDGTNSGIVELVDQRHELFGSSVSAGGSKESGVLIAPAAVKGMLGKGHKFYMRVMMRCLA